MEKVRVGLDRVFKMVSLVRNINASTVKTKLAVSKDMTSVEEVVYLSNDEGACKNKAGTIIEAVESLLDRGSVGVVNEAVGNVNGGEVNAGVGAEREGRDLKEVGLEEVGGDNGLGVVGVSLERENCWKSRQALEKLVNCGKIEEVPEV
jgi:hypothetical protein